ncbi:multicopper oxidase-domain-containing protein [Phakopsora pachyrhizi]|uniref:Multicopper oxidase-domain-containing protein n=1 Tax=Phakopsora pachyrhizi TaxID=170000 RepID=A0AAV0BUX2_PHAPC|nr:multicopper oxidase-domain-containing protein [Phakopsora pachyrhizi]CAH7689399.1 multicopper oxidase-domain-containing protein [Phakopsora pachyrhizi]
MSRYYQNWPPLWLSLLLILSLSLVQSSNAIKFNLPELYLSNHNFEITNVPQVRHYDFVLSNLTGAPDGYSKSMLVINNQFPGPLIECNEGDTLKIMVHNNLDVDVTIHWHGIYQKGTPWMDGVTGVTQCPISAGDSFLYSFRVSRQFGTFWYHAHAQNLAIDGISGPLIVHSPRDPYKRGRDFDNDYILFISDWYHNTSRTILNGTLSAAGYNGSTAAPSANSALINGVGIFDCKWAEPGSKCQTPKNPLEITVGPNERTRFRLIQAGSHAMFWFSADQHLLNVTEADSTAVAGPTNLRRIQFHNGQRYSVIVNTKNDRDGSSFYMRAAMDLDCFAWLAPGLPGPDATALVIVKVKSKGIRAQRTINPTTKDWNDTVGGSCLDLNLDTLKPLLTRRICRKVIGTMFFNTSLGSIVQSTPNSPNKTQTLSRFFVDNTTWTTFRYKPILQDLLLGGKGFLNRSEATPLWLDQSGCYDIVINNLDSSIDHPLHLHGVDAHIVAHGPGKVGPGNLSSVAFKINNPLRRDTFVVGGGSHLVIRLLARNPGVWILHCHIGWHLAAGFAGMIVMKPSRLSNMRLPPANRALCSGKTFANMDTTEPGRRLAKRCPLNQKPLFDVPNLLRGQYVPSDDVFLN